MRAMGMPGKWNADRGFGFIRHRDSGVDIFVLVAAFPRGPDSRRSAMRYLSITKKPRRGGVFPGTRYSENQKL